MAWLFGGLEMDLTAAERAVDELARWACEAFVRAVGSIAHE